MLEEPKIGVVSTNGDAADDADKGKKAPARKGKKGAKAEEPEPEQKPVAEEDFTGGNPDAPGRRFSIRDTR